MVTFRCNLQLLIYSFSTRLLPIMLFQWIWFFFGYTCTWGSHLPQVLWLIMTASHTSQRLPREFRGTGLKLLYPMRTMPWGSQIPQTQIKELQSPKTSNIISSTARQGVITSIHTMMKFLLTKITPSSTTSRRPLPSLCTSEVREINSNKIWNFVSYSFALNFRKLFYLLNWFFFLVQQDTSTSKNTFSGWMTAETMEY